jgi:hypothetical protein
LRFAGLLQNAFTFLQDRVTDRLLLSVSAETFFPILSAYAAVAAAASMFSPIVLSVRSCPVAIALISVSNAVERSPPVRSARTAATSPTVPIWSAVNVSP